MTMKGFPVTQPQPGTPLTLQIPMRWSDMDAYGHINNVEVLRILEEARVHAFGQPAGTGMPGAAPAVPLFSELDADVQALVAEHRVRYLSALQYRTLPATVRVWISAVKGAGFTVAYEIADPVAGTRCVIAETTLAFLHGPSKTVLRLTPAMRGRLRELQGAPLFPN